MKKILITNDDGISAEGIILLAESLAKENEVIVVAPSSEKSACSHGLTIGRPLRYNKVNTIKNCLAYAVDGTPADCVKFAITHFGFNPDLIISGPNRGSNLGTDVMYSGTVGGAIEGAVLGFKSIALSCCWDINKKFRYDVCVDFVVENLDKFMSLKYEYVVWNINVPSTDKKNILGVKVVKQGIHKYSEAYQEIKNGDNTEFFLVGESLDVADSDEDSDVKFSKRNYITVTPLTFDNTEHNVLKLCEKIFD